VITSRDVRYYELALKVSRLSDCSSRHGAVVVRGGNVLSVACNKNTTHPVTRRHKAFSTSVHAEQRALILAASDLRHATVYSARSHGHKIGKPCLMCYELMRDVGIGAVVYWDGNQLVKERL
jgi:deoxycytidylate deaminase